MTAKQYLNMADEFSLPVKEDTLEVYCRQHIGESFGSCEVYAAHAINSHDELVAMNNELLAALKMVWSSAAYAYDGISGQYVILDDERELINSLLEMCDGGAA